ncbi:hypothetical protein [Candidatus Electronema sp. PJ]|uniref:hypothetical protein n=1 Tax=Candidatus Electronema sp. PJ TaxID=3401572 RepID=UPI003AA8023E
MRYFQDNSEKTFLSCSLAKEFGWATEEFCRLAKKLYLPAKEFGRLQLLSKSARFLCDLAKLLGGSTGKQFGQAELLSYRVELLSGRAKLLGQRIALFPKGVPHTAH